MSNHFIDPSPVVAPSPVEERILSTFERMQKVQEYESLRRWALNLSSYDRTYANYTQPRMDRLALLQKELWPDA